MTTRPTTQPVPAPARTRRRAAFAGAAGLALAAVLSGCGSASVPVREPGAGGSPSAPSSPSASATVQHPTTGATDLKISMDDGKGRTTDWTLVCSPNGNRGTHPHPDAACTALVDGGTEALTPVKKGLVCTEIYGGPQTAEITGTYAGAQVLARLTRANGCEISRWNMLKGVLPALPNGPM